MVIATYDLVEDRIISGTGVLRVPVDKVKNRACILYLDVIRQPRNRYLNNNWSPPKGKYAFITYVRNGYVIGNADMEHARQSYDGIADIAGQTLLALKCAHQAVIASIADLAAALNVNVEIAPNIIGAYENLNMAWDEVRIKCYADTAIQARLYCLQYDVCVPAYDVQRKPSPIEQPLPQVPPGQPINSISPPYNDSDPTEPTTPYPGDEVEPYIGVWTIKWKYAQTQGSSTCPYLGSTDTIIRAGKSNDQFGLVKTGTGSQQVWRLTQNGIQDPTALVEVRCTPTFVPPPVFTKN